MIVITGSLVRLTGSGLGCEGWPGCEEGAFFPEEDYHAFVEFGNRVFGIFPITLSILIGVVRPEPPPLAFLGPRSGLRC